MKGTLYGVSVGPGDPELLTLKAVRILRKCAVIAAPQANGDNTVALHIASQAVDLSKKEIVLLPFLMIRDRKKLRENHLHLADSLKIHLDSGRDVAMLSLGDTSVYSSFSYLAELLAQEGYNIEMVAGVTSFCAAAAALKTSLTTMSKPVHIIPVGAETEQALALDGTKVLMKAGRSLPQLLKLLKEKQLLKNTMLVQNCGLPNENVVKEPSELPETSGYFTIVIVKE